MRRKLEAEVTAGIFLFIGLTAAMLTIFMMGGGQKLFEKTYQIQTEVSDVAGLAKGAVVRSGGVKIGYVENISFSDSYDSVKVVLTINESYRQRVREDSVVRFQTQGVLGDKYLEIAGGSAERPEIAPGGAISVEHGKDLSAMFAEGSSALGLLKDNLANLKVLTTALAKKNQMDAIMTDLTETASNMREVSKQLRSTNAGAELGAMVKNFRTVSDRIKNGEGTVGALLTDASLYEDLKNLIGGANRNNVLKFFVRQAVKSSDEAKEAGKEQQEPKKKK